jgi:hypothetical protein
MKSLLPALPAATAASASASDAKTADRSPSFLESIQKYRRKVGVTSGSGPSGQTPGIPREPLLPPTRQVDRPRQQDPQFPGGFPGGFPPNFPPRTESPTVTPLGNIGEDRFERREQQLTHFQLRILKWQ